jgi:hypothetical protein
MDDDVYETPLGDAVKKLRDRREYLKRADDDEEQAQRSVNEAALDLLEAIAFALFMVQSNLNAL